MIKVLSLPKPAPPPEVPKRMTCNCGAIFTFEKSDTHWASFLDDHNKPYGTTVVDCPHCQAMCQLRLPERLTDPRAVRCDECGKAFEYNNADVRRTNGPCPQYGEIVHRDIGCPTCKHNIDLPFEIT